MTEKELENLVKNISACNGTEEEIDEMMDLFLSCVPDPDALRFFSDKKYDKYSAEDIVKEALSYRPIIINP